MLVDFSEQKTAPNLQYRFMYENSPLGFSHPRSVVCLCTWYYKVQVRYKAVKIATQGVQLKKD